MWSRVLRKFDHMIRLLERMVELQQEEVKMSAETDAAVKAMTDQLTATKSAVDTVVLLLSQPAPPPGDPGVPAAQVQAFADTLKANVQPLLDAVAPKPTPVPTPAPPPPPPLSSAPPPPPPPPPPPVS
jgi:hypothetical protein